MSEQTDQIKTEFANLHQALTAAIMWRRGAAAPWHVYCTSCHTEHAAHHDLTKALHTARTHAQATPCCPVWSTTKPTNPTTTAGKNPTPTTTGNE